MLSERNQEIAWCYIVCPMCGMKQLVLKIHNTVLPDGSTKYPFLCENKECDFKQKVKVSDGALQSINAVAMEEGDMPPIRLSTDTN